MKKTLHFALALSSLFLASCAGILQKQSVDRAPNFNPQQISPAHVVKLEADNRGVEQKIAANLTGRGVKTTVGSKEAMPASARTYVTYHDKWHWDMTMYMLQLNIKVYDARSNQLLASAMSERTSMVRKTEEGMVQEVLNMIYRGQHIAE